MKTIIVVLALCLSLFGAAIAQTVPSQSNPDLGTFLSLTAKRADLRVNVSRMGLDAAFSNWLRANKPDAYKSALAQTSAKTIAMADCCTGNPGCCGSCCKA